MLPAQVYKDQEAPAAALMVCLIRRYGVEALEWEPEVARMQIKDDYGIELSPLNSDKLQAAIQVLIDDNFETDWLTFQNICHAFSNVADSFEDFDPLEPEEIIVGLAQAMLIRNDGPKFHDQIRAYVGQVFYNHGYSKAPELFPSAIMPACVPSDDTQKNKTMEELFNFHMVRTTDYLESLG